ncbi:MAG: c-type cytochrome [Thermoanaerobaculia bacterium]
MKQLSILILVAVVTVLALPATFAEEEADAETLFVDTHKCNMCHSATAAGIEAKTKSEKMKGLDLSGYQSDKDLAEIAAYVRKETDIDGASHKKAFKGTDEELQAIIDWLGSLEAQE